MKRNNIFMLSYIVFIFICAWIKPIYDFPMWGKIVVAVTTASWMFAIADCCSCISNIQKETYNSIFPLVDTAKYRINQIKLYLTTCEKDASHDVAIDTIDSCGNECASLLNTIAKTNKRSKVIEKFSVIFTFLAFILFLCVLTFDSVYNYFFARQDGATVLSFGMILLAQFGTNIGTNNINKMKREFTSIVNGWEALLHSYGTEDKCNAD